MGMDWRTMVFMTDVDACASATESSASSGHPHDESAASPAAPTRAKTGSAAARSTPAMAFAKRYWTFPRKESPRWPSMSGATTPLVSMAAHRCTRVSGSDPGPGADMPSMRVDDATARDMSAAVDADGSDPRNATSKTLAPTVRTALLARCGTCSVRKYDIFPAIVTCTARRTARASSAGSIFIVCAFRVDV